MKIQTFQIKVNEGRRKASPEAVHKLADSISEVGLLNPITVDQNYNLIAGLHRLEAAKLLGWAEIECTVSDLSGLLVQLAEIDENLIRRGLDRMEEWKQLARRKEIYEMLHPETKNGISQAIAMNVAQGNNVNAPGASTSKSFVSDTAEKLGISKRTIEENLQLTKGLTPTTKKIIQSMKEKIKKKDMLKLSRLAPEQQKETATQLAAGAIRSVDEYLSATAISEPAEEQVTKPPVPKTGHQPTIRDFAADLKDPNKDRRPTPDTFIMVFSLFLQKFIRSAKAYVANEFAPPLPALTREHLDQIQREISSVHTTLDDLFIIMERKSKD